MSSNPASGTPRAVRVGDGDTFTVDGRQFRLDILPDDCMGPPWKEHDGHGIVSEWTRRDPEEGERVLVGDRGSHRYYDINASIQLALKDGWDAPPYGGTDNEKAVRAVERDFQHLQDWCNDDWSWVCLKVTLLDGEDAGEFETLGGVESNAYEHISDEAHELAGQLLYRVVTMGDK